jgi:hypothetical protein
MSGKPLPMLACFTDGKSLSSGDQIKTLLHFVAKICAIGWNNPDEIKHAVI